MNALFRSRALELTRFEHGIIRRKAGQLIGRAGFSTADRRGLEQELAARLIQAFLPRLAFQLYLVMTEDE